MDDENREEEQPSTSKNETNKERDVAQDRRRQRDEDYDDRERERDRDDHTDTDTSESILSSVRSRLQMRADVRPNVPKQSNGKRDKPERKKRVRRGRVSKRRRSARRYQNYARRMPRNSDEKRHRDPSVSSIFTRMSSRSDSNAAGCKYCGHRCCGRRLTDNERHENKRHPRRQLIRNIIEQLREMKQETSSNKTKGNRSKRKNTKLKGVQKRRSTVKKSKKSAKEPKQEKVRRQRKKRCIPDKKKDALEKSQRNLVLNNSCSGSKANQVGSACKMLSPLFVKTNVIPQEDVQEREERQSHNQITPEMIFQTLRKLHMWKQYANLECILNDIKLCYPVNRNQEELASELIRKLWVAEIAGIVIQEQIRGIKCWCLAYDLKKRGLTKTHVTLFWQIYCDTLSGVKKTGDDQTIKLNNFLYGTNIQIAKKISCPIPIQNCKHNSSQMYGRADFFRDFGIGPIDKVVHFDHLIIPLK